MTTIHNPTPVTDGRYCGYPGLMWYAKSREVRGDALTPGMMLDTPDHRGARGIFAVWAGRVELDAEALARLRVDDVNSGWRTVMVGFGEVEYVRTDVLYPVVDPTSQVAPDPAAIPDHGYGSLPHDRTAGRCNDDCNDQPCPAKDEHPRCSIGCYDKAWDMPDDAWDEDGEAA